MPVEVHVTQEDIDAGDRGCAGSCPIAHALNRQSRDGWLVAPRGPGACTWEASNFQGAVAVVIPLPPEAAEFARRFDGCDPVQPFSFTVPVEAL